MKIVKFVKKPIDIVKFFIIMVIFSPFLVKAQQVNSLYFIENLPLRHTLNPAFQPINKIYLSLPIIGFTQINLNNNSLTLKDVIYNNNNGQTITFLHPNGNLNEFYNSLNTTLELHGNFLMNLLSFGFKSENIFWSFSLSEKGEGILGLPKDIFKLSLYGTPLLNNNLYDLTRSQIDATVYTEAAFGYSKKINDQFSIGGKFKILFGTTNISNVNNSLTLEAGVDKWLLKGQGTVNFSTPNQIDTGNFATSTISISDLLTPKGLGAGIDLGLEYRLFEDIRISTAITDLGFIRWNKNVQNIDYSVDYNFDGVAHITKNMDSNTISAVINKLMNGNALTDSLTNAFQTATNVKKTSNTYLTSTSVKLNLGAEYSILDKRLSFGLLSRTLFFKDIDEEITASINVKPYNWLNTTFSYSLFGGQLSSFGLGVGLRTGFIHWFAATDYFPFQKANFSLSQIGPNYPNINIPIPYNSKNLNLSLGITLVFDEKSVNNKVKTNKHFDLQSINPRTGLHNSKSVKDCHCE